MVINPVLNKLNLFSFFWALVEGMMPCALSKNIEVIVVTDFDCFDDLRVNGSNGSLCDRPYVMARMFFSSSFARFIMAKKRILFGQLEIIVVVSFVLVRGPFYSFVWQSLKDG